MTYHFKHVKAVTRSCAENRGGARSGDYVLRVSPRLSVYLRGIALFN